MKKIVVFNRYSAKHKKINGFSESFREIICNSLDDLGIEFKYYSEICDIKCVRDSTVLSIISPQFVSSHSNIIHKSNYNIWWNIEPISVENDKRCPRFLSKRRKIFNDVMNNLDKYKINRVLSFDERHVGLYKNVSFLPIGFHDCLLDEHQEYKKKVKYLLVGDFSKYRISFFNRLRKELKKNDYKIENASHGKYKGFEKEKKKLSYFMFGLDCPAYSYDDHIHWHRIMIYSASKMVVISSSDLSNYGFIDGVHYFHYKSINDCINLIKNLHVSDRNKIKQIADNMLCKVRNDFYMTKLLQNIFGGENEKDGYCYRDA